MPRKKATSKQVEKWVEEAQGESKPQRERSVRSRRPRVKDPTIVPEFWDADNKNVHIWDSKREVLAWVPREDLVFAQGDGWRKFRYGDPLEGVQDGSFVGTGLFERTPEGWVQNIDCLLMRISKEGYEELQLDREDRNAAFEKEEEDKYFDAFDEKASQLGLRGASAHKVDPATGQALRN